MDTKMLSYTSKYYTIEYEHKGKRFTVTLDKVASVGIPKDAIIVDIDYTIADTPPPPLPNKELCEVINLDGKLVEYVWKNKQKEEGTNPMNTYDECTPCCVAPAAYGANTKFGFKTKAAVANAQVINAVPVEATQRDYAIELIKSIGEKHAKALRVQFNMDLVNPSTFLELEKLIKDGNYTVSDMAREDDAKYCHMFYGVTFGKPADKEGYNSAKEVLKAAAQKALTGVTLKPVDQLEAVIDGFEAWELPNA